EWTPGVRSVSISGIIGPAPLRPVVGSAPTARSAVRDRTGGRPVLETQNDNSPPIRSGPISPATARSITSPSLKFLLISLAPVISFSIPFDHQFGILRIFRLHRILESTESTESTESLQQWVHGPVSLDSVIGLTTSVRYRSSALNRQRSAQ